MTYTSLGKDADGNTISIFQKDRLEGCYIIGATGKGKSALLLNMILDDCKNGHGLCLLDPLGNLFTRVIECIPANRVDDVILLDTMNYDCPFGLNLYACRNPQDAMEVQYSVERVMHVWDRLFGISRLTPQMMDYMFNCAHLLIANPGYTMAEIPLLFYNKPFRDRLLLNVKDPNIHLFWQEYESMWAKDRRTETRAIVNKLNEFLQPLVKNIIGQSTTTIDMQQIMDDRKILLVKLHPNLAGVTSLLGGILVAHILMAAHARNPQKRRQFHFYADEGDRFATPDFKEIYDTCRQFGVGTTFVQQTRATLHKDLPGLARSILQAATTVVFQVTPPDSNELAGKFDTTPPVPKQEEVGRRKKQVPTTDVVGWLLANKAGHPNKHVNEFTNRRLRVLNDIITKDFNTLAGNGLNPSSILPDINAMLSHSNIYKQITTTIPVRSLVNAGRILSDDFHIAAYLFEPRWNDFAPLVRHSFTDLLQSGWEADEMDKILDQELIKNAYKLSDPIVIQWKNGARFFYAVMTEICMVMHLLKQQTIPTDGAEEEVIYRPGPQKSHQERQNEIANQLTGLPKLTARVKLNAFPPNLKSKVCHCCSKPMKATAKFCNVCGIQLQSEYVITIPLTNQGMSPAQLQQRIASIIQKNIADGYVRPRIDVEKEIQQRQQIVPPQQQPPAPQSPTPKPKNLPAPTPQPVPAIAAAPSAPIQAAQAPIMSPVPRKRAINAPAMKQCPSCKAQNVQAAKFCNMCGARY